MQRQEVSSEIVDSICSDYTINMLTQRDIVAKYSIKRGVVIRILKESYVAPRSRHYRRSPRRRTFTCNYCGREFMDFVGNRGKYSLVFCNVKCKGMYMAENWIGSSSPHWMGGKEAIPMEKNWRRTKKRVLDYYNHTCQECGSDEGLHIHHLLPRILIARMFGVEKMRKARDYMKNDLVAYCNRCHSKHYNDYTKILEAATTMISGTLFTKSSWDSLNCAETYRGSEKSLPA